MESDSKIAVDISNGSSHFVGHHQALVSSIRSLLATTGTVVRYIPRDNNSCADWFAKNGLSQTFGTHDFVYLPI